jgi:hypothetical protein
LWGAGSYPPATAKLSDGEREIEARRRKQPTFRIIGKGHPSYQTYDKGNIDAANPGTSDLAFVDDQIAGVGFDTTSYQEWTNRYHMAPSHDCLRAWTIKRFGASPA